MSIYSDNFEEEEEEFNWYKFALDCLIIDRVLDILEEDGKDVDDLFK